MIIRDPIDPHRADRWDRGFVTKEALCRAGPDLREPQGSNPLGPPGPELFFGCVSRRNGIPLIRLPTLKNRIFVAPLRPRK